MSTEPASLRRVEVSGAEALRLLEHSALGRLVYTRRDLPVIRPGRHTRECGRLVVRTPAQAPTYQVNEVRAATGTGWTATATGPAETITDPNEDALLHSLKGMGGAPVRRTPTGWAYGPHDTIVRIHPQTVSGFRRARGTER
ncbi:pyridoxamine 5'-phosphate oxidase family protein [Streptomyces geranii]|uniref:pyridoxamine 5'-phosphate oxidase family protein n=1 Tax=Streptomyces geranii TaxID=2058923 RepID=UPI000D042D6C|nr:pyridoxamine 5'-phosphate oxidase family protein [Streptomyces geranii]